MNYQDNLKQKENNIARIDEFILFLRETFENLDKYDNKYGQLIVLLNKEKRLYSGSDKDDPDVFYKKLREIKHQIYSKISEIKNRIKFDNINIHEELTLSYQDLILKENISNIKNSLQNSINDQNFLSLSNLPKNNDDKDKVEAIKNFKDFCKSHFPDFEYLKYNISDLLSDLEKNIKEGAEKEKYTRTKIDQLICEIKNKISNSNSIRDLKEQVKITDKYINDKKNELLNKDSIKIKNKLLSNEHFKYYLTKSFEERGTKDYFNALLKFHPLILSGISLVGMIYYFAYFGFELKYFPDLGGADVAYVGVSLFFMLATISLFFILPCLCYPGYHKKDIGWIFFFGLSLLPLFTLVCMATLNTIINKSLDVLFWFSLIGSFIYLIIVICTDKFTTFSLCKVAILIIIFPENFSFNGLFFSSIVGLYLMTLVYFKGLEYFYNNNDLLQFVVAFIIVVFAILSWFVTNEFANRLGIANVEYKYLSIEKSALGALPKGICKKTEKDLIRTYYDANDISNVVILYNIKALSTLGKFYYLEAIGCENNEKIRFELDSSKIISRSKE